MSAPHPLTGIPMELALIGRVGPECNIACTGSYHSRTPIFDVLVVSDQDTYHLDILGGTMTTSAGQSGSASEKSNVSKLLKDFAEAVTHGREPLVSGRSVLPCMKLLQDIEDDQVQRLHCPASALKGII